MALNYCLEEADGHFNYRDNNAPHCSLTEQKRYDTKAIHSSKEEIAEVTYTKMFLNGLHLTSSRRLLSLRRSLNGNAVEIFCHIMLSTNLSQQPPECTVQMATTGKD